MKDINGVELVAEDSVKYLGHNSDLGDLIYGKTYKVRYTTKGLMVQLYDVPHLVNPRYLSKVVDKKDIIVEITQSEYEELHEELALKDSLIEDLQTELENTKKLLKLSDKMERFLKWYQDSGEIVVGSKVMLREGSEYTEYNATGSNPLGVLGEVLEVDHSDTHPLWVKWSSGTSNCYRHKDLVAVSNTYPETS